MIVGFVINEDSKGRNTLPPAKVRAEGEHTEIIKPQRHKVYREGLSLFYLFYRYTFGI